MGPYMGSKRLSYVWSYFSEESDRKVKCLICSRQLSVANKSTCGLIRHMRSKHYSQIVRNKGKSFKNLLKNSKESLQDGKDSADDLREIRTEKSVFTQFESPAYGSVNLYEGFGHFEENILKDTTRPNHPGSSFEEEEIPTPKVPRKCSEMAKETDLGDLLQVGDLLEEDSDVEIDGSDPFEENCDIKENILKDTTRPKHPGSSFEEEEIPTPKVPRKCSEMSKETVGANNEDSGDLLQQVGDLFEEHSDIEIDSSDPFEENSDIEENDSDRLSEEADPKSQVEIPAHSGKESKNNLSDFKENLNEKMKILKKYHGSFQIDNDAKKILEKFYEKKNIRADGKNELQLKIIQEEHDRKMRAMDLKNELLQLKVLEKRMRLGML